MVGEMLEEWKNCVAIPTYKTEDKKRRRSIEELAYLMYVINYIVMF
jgi:hypothetical protein